MKVLRSVVLALGLLLVVSAAHAQSGAVAVSIPFNFVVGNELYPAGNYLMSTWGVVRESILIQNRDELRYRMIPTHTCQKLERAEKTVLIFHRYGDQYFLEQVWLKGNTIGRQFFKGNLETQLAKDHSGATVTSVAIE